ncbi:TauD/TfdA family dioxygenase [uncultured Erythrobacter sp.]|uniref:TauD/TfdA family dioxygenase n=1 Tax=uncultured Erythrobacter sp. TaxID=263913 RepID=UPI002607AAB0|nr:TauD/TfdA family dioxygenase [uncultured Erythrobacter sp.]
MTEAEMSEFPGVIPGGGDLAAFLSANKGAVDAALADAGALLFRGFDVPDPLAFDAAIEGYGEAGFTYEDSLSNAVRTNVTERVFTANEAPPTTEIFLHHEMAQTPLYPAKLFFYCEIAPGSGGATPLCRSDWVLEKLTEQSPAFVARLEAEGVRYTNVMPGSDDAGSGQGRSWRSTLSVGNEAAAEARLQELGYSWEWLEDGSLRVTTAALPAMRTLADGRKTFFNQLIAAFRGWADSRNDPNKAITFGGGEPITPEDMAPAIALADEFTHDLAWQAGDVALIDNFAVMHGRRPFEGQRRVLASLIA